ncbi:acyl-homoserine-lactone synthase [Chelativorans salis]|uniref:Acyl-homoserine-lactone synthase n=1 Tax=Chelativorans salis TaxID=2978478 RepID=A0ABT2LUP2_9HYPH|nr:acyl-homoserine-lactone synthase [Chelativorans sp. EGI FJ00035]MCT7378246.1 GNAT family N-acetyltransferase [Chelativorans sp. EGI FJ00035]
MIHVVKGAGAHRYRELLEEHYRLRHEIFVAERGWTDLFRTDGRERDAYDTSQTVYVLATHEGHVTGGYRLLPTTSRHLLGDRFAHLVDGPVPRGHCIREWSRFFIRKDRRGGQLFRQLMKTIPPTCKSLGITTLTSVIEPDWLVRFEAAGFPCRILGPFVETDGMQLAAVQLDIGRVPIGRR